MINDSQYDFNLIGRNLRKKFDVGSFTGVVDHYLGGGDYMTIHDDDDDDNNFYKIYSLSMFS
jgi:hypothetical protein